MIYSTRNVPKVSYTKTRHNICYHTDTNDVVTSFFYVTTTPVHIHVPVRDDCTEDLRIASR